MKKKRTGRTRYYILTLKTKVCYVMTDGQNFFDQPVNNDVRAFESIRKIATGNKDGYTTGCLLYYTYFKENCKLIVIYLSKQQALNAYPKTLQQINFIGNLECVADATRLFFIIKE